MCLVILFLVFFSTLPKWSQTVLQLPILFFGHRPFFHRGHCNNHIFFGRTGVEKREGGGLTSSLVQFKILEMI